MDDADGGFGGAGVKKPPCCLGGKYREDLLDKKGMAIAGEALMLQ